jgi:hypothetical protein
MAMAIAIGAINSVSNLGNPVLRLSYQERN